MILCKLIVLWYYVNYIGELDSHDEWISKYKVYDRRKFQTGKYQ